MSHVETKEFYFGYNATNESFLITNYHTYPSVWILRKTQDDNSKLGKATHHQTYHSLNIIFDFFDIMDKVSSYTLRYLPTKRQQVDLNKKNKCIYSMVVLILISIKSLVYKGN